MINQLRNKFLQGDVLDVLKTLPNNSVHMCVTSPPYFGLRVYEGGEREIGCEQSPEEYVQKLIEIFMEVHRVLRTDGTLWLNLGDSYASNGIYIGSYKERHPEHTDLHVKDSDRYPQARKGTRGGEYKIKAKDLMGIPWRVILSLQECGWYLRRDIVWAKSVSFCSTYVGSCMPEPVRDRPVSSHEYLFLMSKSPRYYYDYEGVKEPTSTKPRSLGNKTPFGVVKRNDVGTDRMTTTWGSPSGRNLRSVWTINPKPFPGAHFATFPPRLIEPAIRAGTSEYGCCSECGEQYARVIEKGNPDEKHKKLCGADSTGKYNGESEKWRKQDALGKNTYTGFNARWKAKQQNASDVKRRILEGMVEKKTVSWTKSCTCSSTQLSRPLVLDPFMGSGTTALVSLMNGRDFVGIELNPEYIKMAEKRVAHLRIKKLSDF